MSKKEKNSDTHSIFDTEYCADCGKELEIGEGWVETSAEERTRRCEACQFEHQREVKKKIDWEHMSEEEKIEKWREEELKQVGRFGLIFLFWLIVAVVLTLVIADIIQ